MLISSFFTYENIYSLLPIISGIIITLSFIQKDEQIIRIIGIISALCWFIYGIIYKSYAAMMFESVILITTFIAFVKNYKKMSNK